MKTKNILLFIIILMIVSGGAFYGGIKYQQSKCLFRQAFQNLSSKQRQQPFQQGVRQRGSTGFLSGEVIAKDEQSITLKMPDGGSRIVFFSDSTQVSKIIDGSIDDIEIGKQIMVSGDQNSDRSITAKIIQLSPRYLVPRNNE